MFKHRFMAHQAKKSARLLLLSTLLVCASVPATAECLRWNISGEHVRLEQSLGGTAAFDLVVDGHNVTGSAKTLRLTTPMNIMFARIGSELFISEGTVDGVYQGDRIELQVRWSDGKVGIYDLRIDQYGRLSGGTYEFARPSSRANVIGIRKLECAQMAEAAPPPPPKPIAIRDAVTRGDMVAPSARAVAPAAESSPPRVTRAIGKREEGQAAIGATASVQAAGRCADGYVWRVARPTDKVCVHPDARRRVASENASAPGNWDPAGAYGPKSCIAGLVWREAFPGDQVCVDPGARSTALRENRLAASRMAR